MNQDIQDFKISKIKRKNLNPEFQMWHIYINHSLDDFKSSDKFIETSRDACFTSENF